MDRLRVLLGLVSPDEQVPCECKPRWRRMLRHAGGRNNYATLMKGYRRKWVRGQALVEMALIAIVMAFLLVGAIDLGRVFYGKITVTDAAKEGALVASQGGRADAIKSAAVDEAAGGFVTVLEDNVTVPATLCPANATSDDPPGTIIIEVEAPFTALTPIVAAILSESGGMVGATAEAQCRYTPDMPSVTAPPATAAPTVAPPVEGAPCTKPNGDPGYWHQNNGGQWQCQ